MAVTASQDKAPDAASLLAWYDRARRELPWRAKPGETADPYRVWLSEIMLQQTTVAAVIPYFERFVRRWPDIEALAAASPDEVLTAWAGLGYYARARNLMACAEQVAGRHGGRFPRQVDGLRALPGIGPYTASAIAAIAFGRRVAAVDGNVERVIARVYGLRTVLPGLKREVGAMAEALVPARRCGDFAQAMMDLGATVCTPRKPACGICPWTSRCRALSEGIAAQLPRRAPRQLKPVRTGIAFWLERGDGHVLLRRREPRGLLGGMLEVPSTPWLEAGDAAGGGEVLAHAPGDLKWRAVAGEVRHTFTHFDLRLALQVARIDKPGDLGSGYDPDQIVWADKNALDGHALPSVMRKVAAHAASALAENAD